MISPSILEIGLHRRSLLNDRQSTIHLSLNTTRHLTTPSNVFLWLSCM